jgi:hypothetical protein
MSFSKGKTRQAATTSNQAETANKPKGKRPDGNLVLVVPSEVADQKPTYVQLAAVFANLDEETGELRSYTISSREGFTVEPGQKIRLYFNRPSAE